MEGPESANKKESSTGDRVVAAAALGAAVFAGVSGNADARVTPGTADTAEKNPVIASKQKELNSAPLLKGVLKNGETFVIEHETGIGQPLVLKTSGGKTLLSVPTSFGKNSPDEVVKTYFDRMTPEKVAFELQAGRGREIEETVNGTKIKITPYADSLMKYLGISYSTGTLSYGSKSLDLTKDDNVRNEKTEIKGYGLEDRIVICTLDHGKDGKSLNKLVYFIDKDGRKYISSQGDAEEVLKYCK